MGQSTRAAQQLEDLTKVLNELKEENVDKPIVVEGSRDEKALRELGVIGEIIQINQGLHIFNLAEQLAMQYNEIIILTDWDRRGGMLARSLSEALAANGCKSNLNLRAKISMLCKKDINDVESLDALVIRLERR